MDQLKQMEPINQGPEDENEATTAPILFAPTTGTGTGTGGTPVPLDPVSGAALYDLEVSRRRALALAAGPGLAPGTGCPEVDHEVLLCGGFERGCVVGVSAEDVDFGVLVGLFRFLFVLVLGTLLRWGDWHVGGVS